MRLTSTSGRNDYHQGFSDSNPDQPFCRLVVAPNPANFPSTMRAG